MDFKEEAKKLKANPELVKKLEDAIGRKADPTGISAMLVEAGFDAEEAEALVAEYQRRFGLAVADDDLDEEMLRKVAGGGTGNSCSQADDCDDNFKKRDYWSLDRCGYQLYCDELYES